jgi:hypothetical protein
VAVILQIEFPKRIELHDGTRLLRRGACCRCGDCCKGDPFVGEMGDAQVPGYCPLFRWTEDGSHGVCSDRTNPYYLSGPNIYPSKPEQIADKPACTYSFEVLDAG